GEAETVTRGLIVNDHEAAARVLARAESMLDHVEAAPFAAHSSVLRRGLTYRLAELGDALRRCADRADTRAHIGGPDAPLADSTVLREIEEHRVKVEAHALQAHPDEVRVPRALAAVRLARWLGQPVATAMDLGMLVARHRDEDAWVDRAVADAWPGVHDEALAQGLNAVLGAVRLRRAAHDRAFAKALAAHEDRAASAPGGVVHLENLLAATVLPLAKRTPVLLVVADGMSQTAATEIVDDVVRRYDTWLECLPEGNDRRLTALAPHPSVTKVCRASLFSGELTVGEQSVERAGFEMLTKSHGVNASLFYKLALDSSPGGYALAHEVRAAIDDVVGTPLVACVLNTIDDALDRSDPDGTDWTADTVKHLHPLLERARQAGRVVVLTSDHGHVVERREGRVKQAPSMSSNRSRPYAGGGPLDESEVRVRGRRVLLHDGDAVLAVDEGLRYGPLKAGYHGGASPAEVVVPVSVLAPGEAPPGWRLAPPQSPGWWRSPVSEAATPSAPVALSPQPSPLSSRGQEPPTLFDAETEPRRLEGAVLASAVYREQRRRASRTAVTDEQVGDLLAALLAAPDHRLDAESAAAALGVAAIQLSGALSQVQRLLNVEQYPVLSRDADGKTLVLDVDLLCEQFEVRQ
ncbi:MAG: BREX-2 system phosphatase PglZ, partial [Dactylosporangium sp.]|nr:BREX-2 system phosphatase PglZ [Dactylosporangium sp.]